MLDWALSKIIVSIFTMFLVIFSVFVFSVARDDIEETKLKSISNEISSKVNELSNTHSNSSVYFTFRENASAVTLPSEVDGEKYDIRISSTDVNLEADGKIASSDFTAEDSKRVHLWDPDNIDYVTNETELNDLDDENRFVDLVSGEGFRVVRSELIVNGEIQYHTFIFGE
ncbi:MAG: hypothetical protein V5A88_05845 [Candidatus Thermoplasmatota archaeon]